MYVDWLTTSATNPVFTGACGEVVAGAYFLPASTGPDVRLECDVPVGVPVVVTSSQSDWRADTTGPTVVGANCSAYAAPLDAQVSWASSRRPQCSLSMRAPVEEARLIWIG